VVRRLLFRRAGNAAAFHVGGVPMCAFGDEANIVSTRRADLLVILIAGRHEIAELPRAKHNWFFLKPFDGHMLLAATTRRQ